MKPRVKPIREYIIPTGCTLRLLSILSPKVRHNPVDETGEFEGFDKLEADATDWETHFFGYKDDRVACTALCIFRTPDSGSRRRAIFMSLRNATFAPEIDLPLHIESLLVIAGAEVNSLPPFQRLSTCDAPCASHFAGRTKCIHTFCPPLTAVYSSPKAVYVALLRDTVSIRDVPWNDTIVFDSPFPLSHVWPTND